MSLVRGLVLLHLSATALLTVVFLAVLAWQRGADVLRARRATRRTPAVVPAAQPAGASVLEWTIDLRDPVAADGAPLLSKTS